MRVQGSGEVEAVGGGGVSAVAAVSAGSAVPPVVVRSQAGASAPRAGVDAALLVAFDDVYSRFQARVADAVAYHARRGRVSDHWAVEGQVWLQAWRAFPRMMDRQRARQLEGGLPHSWGRWLRVIADRVVIDQWRRTKLERAAQAVGVRRRFDDEPESEFGWLLDVAGDELADPLALDPAVVVEGAALREVLRSGVLRLPRRQLRVLCGWLAQEPDRGVARRLGVSVDVVREERRRALSRLRAYLRGSGYTSAV